MGACFDGVVRRVFGPRSGAWCAVETLDPELVGLDGEPGDGDLLDEGIAAREGLEEFGGGGAAVLAFADVEEEPGLGGEVGGGGRDTGEVGEGVR